MIVEAKRRWEEFAKAFNALGNETRGMSPVAASVLLVAAAEYEDDNTKGYQPLLAGVPEVAVCSGGDLVVDIDREFCKCDEFWEFDSNHMRAKITSEGVDYVKKHVNVFDLLLPK